MSEIAKVTGHVLWPKIESGRCQRVRQACIGITRDRHVRFFREFLEKWVHEIRAKRAVQAHGQRFHMPHRVPECLGRLRRDHRLSTTSHRRRDHHWQFFSLFIKNLTDSDQCGLGVERIKDRLTQQQVYAPGNKSTYRSEEHTSEL